MSRRAAVVLAGAALAAAGLPVLTTPAQALTAPVAFTAAQLSTWQTDGIVWSVAEAGGLVFVGGTFTSVRPPGAASGDSRSLARKNLAVFNGATGEPTTCAPVVTNGGTNSTVRALDVSPDGKTLYVGGLFSSIGGSARSNLGALDLATCKPVSGFAPTPNATVRAIAATSTSVYYGGDNTSVGGVARPRAAAAGAVGTTSVGKLLAWSPKLDKNLRALAVRPGGGEVVLGGDFDTVNGTASNALATVDPESGATVTAYGTTIPAASVVKDIAVDPSGLYTGNEGTGFQQFDGRLAFDWGSATPRWTDDCYGATQAVTVHEGVLYSGSHVHDCTRIGAFPDGIRYHLLAEPVSGPTLLPWFPQTNDGIGEKLGPRDMVVSRGPSGQFMWVVGEFTTVNGTAQQGLTRFGGGPAQKSPSSIAITANSVRAGEVQVAWRPSTDPDDGEVTYNLYRGTTLVHTAKAVSWFWNRPQLSFVDTGRPVGSTQSYYVTATDGTATVKSGTASAVVASRSSAYTSRVLADGATAFWRFNETSGALVSDTSAAGESLTISGSSSRTSAGVLPGEANRALVLAGSPTSRVTLHSERRAAPPTSYSVEMWFKTTTTTGGKLIGFGDKQVVNSRFFDRHVYMTDAGQLVFGTDPNSAPRVNHVTSPLAYNDGAWHHAVATQGSTGMKLYVDAKLVASNTVTSNLKVPGYWRLGGDNLACATPYTCQSKVWPSLPTSESFSGTIDEAAVYPKVLSATTIAEHRALGLDATPAATEPEPTPTTAPSPAPSPSPTAPPADTTAPTTPQGLTAAASGTSVALDWSASSDDTGVTAYDVHRSTSSGFTPSAATRVASVTATAYTDTTAPAGTHHYRVVARDAAGNASSASAQASATTSAPATTVAVQATEDAYANAGATSTTYNSTSLASRYSSGYRSYLRFAVPTAPAGKTLVSASLRIRTTNEMSGTTPIAGSTDTHQVHLSGSGWAETTLTWTNKPALQGAALGAFVSPSTPSTSYAASLDTAPLAAAAGSDVSLSVGSASGTDNMWFASSENGTTSARPSLVLTYE